MNTSEYLQRNDRFVQRESNNRLLGSYLDFNC